MGIPWDGTGMNCYGMGWDGQKNMPHGPVADLENFGGGGS